MSKVIVITGAGSGLGRALARQFGADGHQVVLLGRTLDKLEAVAASIGDNAVAMRCDISAPDGVRAAFAAISGRFSKVDVLINNAMFCEHSLIEDAADEHIAMSVGANLLGPVFCARAAIPLMGPGACILNVSSGAVEKLFGGLVLYGSTKAALELFSRRLRIELEPQKIRVLVVRCGQMIDDDHDWDNNALADQTAAFGIDPRKRASSLFSSVAPMFRALIDMPADLDAEMIHLTPRRT